jgi:hypothetical protein
MHASYPHRPSPSRTEKEQKNILCLFSNRYAVICALCGRVLAGAQVLAFFGSSATCYFPAIRQLFPCCGPLARATAPFDQPSENKWFSSDNRSQGRAGTGRKQGKQGE